MIQRKSISFAFRQLQMNLPKFHTTNWRWCYWYMHTYEVHTSLRRLFDPSTPPNTKYELQKNVFSTAIISWTTSCVSDARLYLKIQKSTNILVHSTVSFPRKTLCTTYNPFCSWKLIFSTQTQLLSCYLVSKCHCLKKKDFVLLCIDTPAPNHWCWRIRC